MNNMISVIIPVYNVEKYIKKCVYSVTNQTYSNLEIILVDDGSTDNSKIICDELALKDSRISVIHQKNEGLSSARNKGIDNASGEWIAFLDSDDWIDNQMYETLLNVALSNNVLISSCSTRFVDAEGKSINQNNYTGDVFKYNEKEMIFGLLTQEHVRFEVWNKLWNRKLVGNTRFIVGQVSEDIHFDRILFHKAKSMAHVDCAYHNYLTERDGNTKSKFRKGKMGIFKEFDLWVDDIKKYSQEEDTIEVVNTMAVAFAIGMYEQACITGQSENIKKELELQVKKRYQRIQQFNYMDKKQILKVKLFYWNPEIFMFIRNFICKISSRR